jgi:hypothetical protein
MTLPKESRIPKSKQPTGFKKQPKKLLKLLKNLARRLDLTATSLLREPQTSKRKLLKRQATPMTKLQKELRLLTIRQQAWPMLHTTKLLREPDTCTTRQHREPTMSQEPGRRPQTKQQTNSQKLKIPFRKDSTKPKSKSTESIMGMITYMLKVIQVALNYPSQQFYELLCPLIL